MDEQYHTRGQEYLPSKSAYFKNCRITRYLHMIQICLYTANSINNNLFGDTSSFAFSNAVNSGNKVVKVQLHAVSYSTRLQLLHDRFTPVYESAANWARLACRLLGSKAAKVWSIPHIFNQYREAINAWSLSSTLPTRLYSP